MKILSSQQIHEWDAYTITEEPISSIDLMERAARQCCDFIGQQNFIFQPIQIFCGKGNNGGDGLALARLMIAAGWNVTVYILEFGAKGTSDFQVNLQRLHELTTHIYFIQSVDFFPEIEKENIVVDALYGSGLNRPLEGLNAALVSHINQSQALVIAVDLPSGMFTDKSSVNNPVIYATYTLTFQSLKLCFLIAENEKFFGRVSVLDIGLHAGFLENVKSTCQLITPSLITAIFKPRKSFAHKGNFGHALIVAGNKGKTGAALLTSKACLRSGAGLVTANIPEQYFTALHTYVPEAMCSAREAVIDFGKSTAAAVGPGLGTEEDAEKIVLQLLNEFNKPMVIDADGLNIIAVHKDWLQKIPPGSVITPHPKEFERLFGKAANEFERVELALALSSEYSFTIVLKGHYTLIAANGNGWFNITGNPGMAKGGTGDILTGIITAFIAQKYTAVHAALVGVYLHGLAADIALDYQSLESLLAGDIIEHLGRAFAGITTG